MEHPISIPEEEPPRGVISVRVDNKHYIVTIRWADGEVSEHHFPEGGFDVGDSQSKQPIRKLKGEEAVELLKRVSGEINRLDFTWSRYVLPKEHK